MAKAEIVINKNYTICNGQQQTYSVRYYFDVNHSIYRFVLVLDLKIG